MTNTKIKKRLLLEVSSEMHKEVKHRATFKGVSIRAWILQAIVEKIKKEQQYE